MTITTPDLFNVHDRVVLITGGYGVLGGSMARALAAAGARVTQMPVFGNAMYQSTHR